MSFVRISVLVPLFILFCSSCVRQEEGLGPGRFAPDLPLLTLEGEEVTLREVTNGKVVLLNFWTSWCQPCKIEMPDLEKLHQRFGHDSFAVVGIAVDDNKQAIHSFIDSTGITFPVYYDRGGLSNARFGLAGYPESFFLDPQGKLLMVLDPASGEPVVKIIGPRNWQSEQTQILVQSLLDRVGNSSANSLQNK